MTASVYPESSTTAALLRNGSVARIRAIRPADAAALNLFHEHLDAQTIYRRFFSFHPHLLAGEVEHFTAVDYQDRFALVAESDHELIAVARYDRTPGTDRAEVAFVVADAFQNQGLATVLLEHLAAAAHQRGIVEFTAETLATNSAMQAVFARTGFASKVHTSQGIVDVSFRIDPTERYLDAVMHRDWATQRARAQARFCTLGKGRLGVACASERAGVAVQAELKQLGVDISMLLIMEQLDIDAVEALAILAADPRCYVIALQIENLTRPRTFLASARAATRRMPVIACGLPTGMADQAGIALATSGAALARAAGDALTERRWMAWHPTVTGTLPEPVELDVAGAHQLLATLAGAGEHRPTESDGQLAEELVLGLLKCYGMAPAATAGDANDTGVVLTVADRDGCGLGLAVSSSTGTLLAHRRLLPLTDRDLTVMMGGGVTADTDISGLVDIASRLSRLVADQPEISRAQAWLAAGLRNPRVRASLWGGPARGFDDDPFVRRVPVRPSSPAV